MRIHHLSSFSDFDGGPSAVTTSKRDIPKCSLPSKTRGANFSGMMAQSVEVSVSFSVSSSTISVDEIRVRGAHLSAGHDP